MRLANAVATAEYLYEQVNNILRGEIAKVPAQAAHLYNKYLSLHKDRSPNSEVHVADLPEELDPFLPNSLPAKHRPALLFSWGAESWYGKNILEASGIHHDVITLPPHFVPPKAHSFLKTELFQILYAACLGYKTIYVGIEKLPLTEELASIEGTIDPWMFEYTEEFLRLCSEAFGIKVQTLCGSLTKVDIYKKLLFTFDMRPEQIVVDPTGSTFIWKTFEKSAIVAFLTGKQTEVSLAEAHVMLQRYRENFPSSVPYQDSLGVVDRFVRLEKLFGLE
jgi:hypothetical protein